MPNERGRIHEHKAPFRKQLSAQAFSVHVRDAFRTRTWSLSSGLCFQVCSSRHLLAFAVLLLAVIKQRCFTASAPFCIGSELPEFIIRPHAPNRDTRTMTVRYKYMYRANPNIIYIYICMLQSEPLKLKKERIYFLKCIEKLEHLMVLVVE